MEMNKNLAKVAQPGGFGEPLETAGERLQGQDNKAIKAQIEEG